MGKATRLTSSISWSSASLLEAAKREATRRGKNVSGYISELVTLDLVRNEPELARECAKALDGSSERLVRLMAAERQLCAIVEEIKKEGLERYFAKREDKRCQHTR